MILDLKDATTWDPIISKGLLSILGNSYTSILKKMQKVFYTQIVTRKLAISFPVI